MGRTSVTPNMKVGCPEEMFEHCLRALGHPVINIEIDEQQAYDRIYQAIQNFTKRHYDGATEVWEPYEITEADATNGYVIVPEKFSTIVDLIDPWMAGAQNSTDPFDNFNFRLVNTDFFQQILYGNGSISSYHIMLENLELIKRYFTPTRKFTFNSFDHKLWLSDKSNLVAGRSIVLHGYTSIDLSEPDLYNSDFLKKYCTALMGVQWGNNISKYNGIQLPGGLTMDGASILQRYQAEVEKLEQQLKEEFELPAVFFMA